MNYFESRIKEIENQIKNTKALNYIFISDLHFMGIATGQGAVLIEQIKQVCAAANRCDDIDFVVLGGDTVQGYWDDKNDCFDAYNQILSYLTPCTKPVLILMGNHDENAYAAWNPDYGMKIISDLDWQRVVLNPYAAKERVHPKEDTNSKHYYFDIEKNGEITRIFCLDAADNEMEYDKNTGKVTKLYLVDGNTEDTPEGSYKYKTGMSVWGYSGEQIRWLANALSLGGFKNALIFSHTGIDNETNRIPVKFGDELRCVIRAYNTKTAYKNKELKIDVDYSDAGKILCYHYGHIHKENKLYSEDINLWQIASSTARADQSAPQDERELGTDTEGCFDVVSVGTDSIKKFNIGGGTDYVLKQN